MSQLKVSSHLQIRFKDIEKATNNFETCIGKGGYGQVYKGELLIHGKLTKVAVKRLYEHFGQGSKEFLTEITLLSGQKHPNLISLLGYCEEAKEKILVYEYVERGSLDQYLRHDNTTTYTLTWRERLKICLDIARGLDHLHNHVGKHQTIIHRDIKSANILVDHNWVAKISDLGLSKLSLAGLNRSTVISHACGTPGYCEPEYISSGIVKKESDIYSFGVVLLEILCGRLCTIKDDKGLFLLDYYKRNELDEIIHPGLRKQMSSYLINKYLEIAYGCLHKDRQQRYPADRVVKEFEELQKIESSWITDDGKSSEFISLEELRGWSSNSSSVKHVTRRTNVGKVFDAFDLNRDGGLSREELAAFLTVTNYKVKHSEEEISTYVDEVFYSYDKYVHHKKGLTYHGLLQYYDDGQGDLDSDIAQLTSDHESNKNREETAARESLLEKIGGFPNKVFHWYYKFIDHKMNDNGVSVLDLNVEALELDLKSNNDDEAASLVSSPDSLVTIKASTDRQIFLWLFVSVLILLVTMILFKLRYVWFVLVMLANVNTFKIGGLWNRFRGSLSKNNKQD